MTGNIYRDLPIAQPLEEFRTLFQQDRLRIERIVSHGQASPPGFWYEQPQTEWVLLLRGRASLRFADEPGLLVLEPGDFLAIAPHRRHRVESTDPHGPTLWLAIHLETEPQA